jgi:hypothetical protein
MMGGLEIMLFLAFCSDLPNSRLIKGDDTHTGGVTF